MPGEGLEYKPGVVDKDKFVYSPLGKVFNKGFDESDKQEGLLKRLKNIEDTNKRQEEQSKLHLNLMIDTPS